MRKTKCVKQIDEFALSLATIQKVFIKPIRTTENVNEKKKMHFYTVQHILITTNNRKIVHFTDR
jgi:hypothetical protein